MRLRRNLKHLYRMNKKISIATFCLEAIQKASIYSRHFYELDLTEEQTSDPSRMMEISTKIMDELCEELVKYKSNIRSIIVYFPLQETPTISGWSLKSSSHGLIVGLEPPLIYVMYSDDAFGLEFEQYICPIKSVNSDYMVFRSSRSLADALEDFEFSNAIMVIRHL